MLAMMGIVGALALQTGGTLNDIATVAAMCMAHIPVVGAVWSAHSLAHSVVKRRGPPPLRMAAVVSGCLFGMGAVLSLVNALVAQTRPMELVFVIIPATEVAVVVGCNSSGLTWVSQPAVVDRVAITKDATTMTLFTIILNGLTAPSNVGVTTDSNHYVWGHLFSFNSGADPVTLSGFALPTLTDALSITVWSNATSIHTQDLSAVIDLDGTLTSNGLFYYAFASPVTLTPGEIIYTIAVEYTIGAHMEGWITVLSGTITSSHAGLNVHDGNGSYGGITYSDNPLTRPTTLYSVDGYSFWILDLFVAGATVTPLVVSGATGITTSVFRKGHSAPLVTGISSEWFTAEGGTGSTVVTTSKAGLTVAADVLSVDSAPGADTLITNAGFSAAYDGTDNPLTLDLDIGVVRSFDVATADATPVDAITADFNTLATSGGSTIVLSASTFTSRDAATMAIGTDVAFTQGTTVDALDKDVVLTGSVQLTGTSTLDAGTQNDITLTANTVVQLEDASALVNRALVSPGASKVHTTTTGKVHNMRMSSGAFRMQQSRQAFTTLLPLPE